MSAVAKCPACGCIDTHVYGCPLDVTWGSRPKESYAPPSSRSSEEILRHALTRIERWFGEFPATGKAWEDGSPMSYSACFGSNGERDYMRQVARNALHNAAIAPRSESAPTWISVKDRQPADMEIVQVWGHDEDEGFTWSVAQYDDGEWHIRFDGGCTAVTEVTHWQPIAPEGPRTPESAATGAIAAERVGDDPVSDPTISTRSASACVTEYPMHLQRIIEALCHGTEIPKPCFDGAPWHAAMAQDFKSAQSSSAPTGRRHPDCWDKCQKTGSPYCVDDISDAVPRLRKGG